LATLLPEINGWDFTLPSLRNSVFAPHFGVSRI